MNFLSDRTIESVNFFTTYRCNSRCVNCFIWKGDDRSDIEPLTDEEIHGLFYDDPIVSRCHEIGFAGGEPTISSFFWRALELVPENRHITITTNALSSAKLIKTLNERRDRENFVIQVSIDGIGTIHDETRGIKGSYDKSLFLLERLRELGVPRLISFTINSNNFHQLLPVYEIAEALGAEFSTRMAYCGGAYKNGDGDSVYSLEAGQLASMDYSIKRIIDSEIRKKNHYPARIVFLSKISDYCTGKQKDIECGALHSGAVIDLYGDVFPNCPVIMKRLGNIREKAFDAIWRGEAAEKLRYQVEKFACGGCWNDCQVITNIANDRPFLEKNYSDIKLKPFLEKTDLKYSFEMSDPESSGYLGTGWHHLEGQSDFIYRWTAGHFVMAVPKDTVSVSFFCMPAPVAQGKDNLYITARTDEGELARQPITSFEWQDIQVRFKAPFAENGICFFEMSQIFRPVSGMSGSDVRDLGMAVKSVKFIK